MFENLNFASIVVVLTIIFISTAVHETTHAYVALRLGDDLAYLKGRITLNPLKHIDPFLTIALPFGLMILGLPPILAAKPVPINPNRVSGREMGMALIAVAGPVSNLIMAALTAVVLRTMSLGGFALEFISMFFVINVGLFIFNMLPIPPIDGSRLLYAFAPEPVQRVMEQIEGFGVLGVILIISVLYPFLGPVLGNLQHGLINILLG